MMRNLTRVVAAVCLHNASILHVIDPLTRCGNHDPQKRDLPKDAVHTKNVMVFRTPPRNN